MDTILFESGKELDWDEALLRLGGKRKLIEDMLHLFCERNDREIEQLLAWISSKQWTEVSKWAHKTAGLTGTLGLTNIHRLCYQLQRLALIENVGSSLKIVVRIQEKTALLRREI